MADDKAEHPTTPAGPEFAPGSLLPQTSSETPVSGTEHQSQGEPETAEATSLAETETSAATEPAETRAPGTEAESGEQSPVLPAEPARPPEKPRSRFPALAATAIAGGLLGFGGTIALHYLEGSRSGSAAFDAKMAALNARLDAIEDKSDAAAAAARTALDGLERRVAAAESAASKAAETANSAAEDTQKAIAAGAAPQELTAGANPSEAPDLGPLNAKIGTIEQKLASLESAMAAPKTGLRAEPQEQREDPAAKQGSRAAAIAIVAESLLHKLASGETFSDELAALENLGIAADQLAPLRAVPASAVARESQLAAQFTALAPAIIATESAKQAGTDEGFLDRVTRHAKGLVHVRRVGDAEALDVQSIVERIEKALADHELGTAYQEWRNLPGPAAEVSQNWADAAKARLDAMNAARSIEDAAVTVLGKTKS